MLLHQIACWLSIGSTALAGLIPREITRDASLLKSTPLIAERQDGACTNGPKTRSCWSNGFSIATDFDAKSPPAGTTVTYNLVITNTTIDADGSGSKLAMLIRNEADTTAQFPGPLIRASWGDTIIVNVRNNLTNNGTGIHWHGVRYAVSDDLHLSNPETSEADDLFARQLNSCQHDGVPGITECPIAPGKTRQYVFKATQFGTSWYHSHWSAQYSEGVVGTIIIDGPATSNYDEDLGTVPITDYYYKPGFELNEQAQISRTGPPIPDNILVNGKHKSATGTGEYFKMTVTKGKKYRVRLINTSVDSTFHVSFDGHPFTVITADFVPIKPYSATQVTLNIGQRHDVIINANQTAGNYWMRVAIGTVCGRNSIISSGIPLGAILHYDTANNDEPTTTGVTMRTGCDDETNLVPFVPNTVPSDIVAQNELALGSLQDNTTDNLFRWTIDGSSQRVNWNQPTLKSALEGSTVGVPNANVYNIPTQSNWYLWVIQSRTVVTLAHPIHLHGHDFYIVGRGGGVWDGTTTGLTFNNPTRRDTAILPAGGYLLLAFPADNPGMWVMHCHIAWHASQGLSVQFLESQGAIAGKIGDTTGFNTGCTEWNDYWKPGNHPYEQTDSGI